MQYNTHTNLEPTYTDYQLRLALTDVFRSVYFVNKREKHKLQDSYFLNFCAIVDYARENDIDEMQHILDIRRILLTYPQTYEAR